jgi:homoserine dehydrogenase
MPAIRNLALLGFGNVGRTFVDLLERKRGVLREQYGIEFRLTGVATRRLGWIANPHGLDSAALLRGEFPAPGTQLKDVRDWIAAARAEVVFETTSLNRHEGQPAVDHIRAALECGADAISANKGPVVFAYQELRDLARARGKRFLFESAVMDGVPIFSTFAETVPAVEVRGFRGILNSTTNLVLEQMEAGATLQQAVRKAQDLGVAETDPSNDLDGWDATFKTVAVSNVIMGGRLRPDEVHREGIGALTGEQVRTARDSGHAYKLVCEARRLQGAIVASVAPERLPLTDPLAWVNGISSAINFETDMFPGLVLTELDGGLDATAYGLLADFIRASRS